MGSLVSGWDVHHAPGKPPAGFEDYKELKCVHKPHAPPGATSTSEAAHGTSSSSSGNTAAGGPPTLARSSAPPPIHGAAAVHRYLSRSSSGSAPSSPRAAPGSPRSTAPKRCVLKLGADEEEELSAGGLHSKEHWFQRMPSAVLNQRPDEEDRDAWRHGPFKLEDAIGIAAHHDQVNPDPSSTTSTSAATTTSEEDGASPGTPPSTAAASVARPAGPRVTVTRVMPAPPEADDVAAIAASLASASL